MNAFPTALLIERPLIYASIYELSTIVFGSEGLAKLSTGDDKDEFDKLRVRHEIAQASKLLIEVAVVLRNLIDSDSWPMDPIHEIRVERRPEINVGVVRKGSKNEKVLTFRQACNKIIHAEHISFGMKEMPGKMKCLNGSVELHGKRNKDTWVADIQVADFIRMAVRQL
ncbi:hypothetical protein [Thalassotalea marina]|uniref:Uncharacterized protein n=1 Tax=Thalassotalea marina TaxID=1673741 RepID=A0A919BHU8_9GAMM|nr:hypothetical protein [Thalassotalea marina]GHF91399.1 hypothetical protein GCM10017161_19040 [Thalassotalea marina]